MEERIKNIIQRYKKREQELNKELEQLSPSSDGDRHFINGMLCWISTAIDDLEAVLKKMEKENEQRTN